MKRSILLCFVLILCSVSLRAQYAAYYIFEAANGTAESQYIPLTGATDLTGATALSDVNFDNYAFISTTAVKAFEDMMSDETQAGFPIGFTFNYGNKDFDRFMPTSEGYIALANGSFKRSDILPVGNHFAPYAIGLRADGPTYRDAATKVAYKLEGGDGNHILSVEFQNFYYAKSGNTVTGGLNYTVRLYENGGKIEFYFGSMVGSNALSALDRVVFAIGLNVATDPNPDPQNTSLHYRQPSGRNAEFNWDETTQVNYFPTDAKLMTNATIAVGTVWAFTKPAPCTAPDAAKPYISVVRPEGFRVDYDWTDVAANGFVTFASATPLADDVQPADGTVYRWMDRLGTAFCLGTEPLDAEELYTETPKMEPGTDYYVYTWLYNERCAGPRTYGPRGEAVRLSAPEMSMTYENNRIALFPQGSDTLAVLVTSIYGAKDMNNVVANVGRFGIPTASHKVGDTVWTLDGEFGGVMIYKDKAPTAAFTYDEPLKSYTNYHFAAFRRNAAGDYTSAFAQADTLTAPVIPFVDDFSTTIPSQSPSLYICDEFIKSKTTGCLEASIAAKSMGAAAILSLETPELLFPQETDARLILDYNYTVEREDRQTPNLTAEDYAGDNGLRFSISADGQEWTEVYAITATNPDLFSSDEDWKQRYITLPGFHGQRCRVRIEVTGEAFERQAKMKIRTLSIVEKPDCDAPLSVSLTAGSVLADSASLTWVPFNTGQTQGTVAYRLASGSDWTVLCETGATALRVSGLPNRTNVVLGVKTRCTGGSESVYTSSDMFLTGYQMPFVEDFSQPGVYESGNSTVYALPEGWATSTEEIAADGSLDLFTDANTMNFDAPVVDWETHQAYDPQTAGDNAVRLGSALYVKQSWLALPPFIIPEAHTAVLSFDAALLHHETFAAATAATVAANAKLTVYATVMTAADDLRHQTFTQNDLILTVDAAALAEIGTRKRLEASLGQLSGKVRVGFCYTFGTLNGDQTKYNQLYLDHIALAEPCGAVADLHMTALDKTAAAAAWRVYPNVTAYKVTVAAADASAEPIVLQVQEPKVTVSGLAEQTAYKLTVTYACGEGGADESARSEITFTTAGAPCYTPQNLSATEITKTSAVLNWTGEAETYRLEYKEVSAAAYTSREVTGTAYRLTDLNAGASYVFRVQAACNALAGELSDWSETATFRTQSPTCIAPDNIKVAPSFSLAEVTWQGTADQYQIAWRRAGETSMIYTTAFVSGEAFTIQGLKAETMYHVRVRSICAAGDTSAYSEVVAFTTLTEPVCPLPTQLRVEDTALTSATLAWTANEQHEGYLFRFRETAVTAWDSVKDLTATTYTLDNLKANTAYIWSVNAMCSENRTSGWAAANEFRTAGGTANEDVLHAGFDWYVTNGHLHLLNRSGLYVSTIEIYMVDGRKAGRYTVNTNENVLIPVSLGGVPVMVVLQTETGRVTYKILLP